MSIAKHTRPKIQPTRLVSTKRRTQADVISDVDYESALLAQDAVLYTQEHLREILANLRDRMARGATERSEKYCFDLERGIVRRKPGVKTG